jgi:hypothetical protein
MSASDVAHKTYQALADPVSGWTALMGLFREVWKYTPGSRLPDDAHPTVRRLARFLWEPSEGESVDAPLLRLADAIGRKHAHGEWQNAAPEFAQRLALELRTHQECENALRRLLAWVPAVNLYDMERSLLSVYKTYEALTDPVSGWPVLRDLFREVAKHPPGFPLPDNVHPTVRLLALALWEPTPVALSVDAVLLRLGDSIGTRHAQDGQWGRAPMEFAHGLALALHTNEECEIALRRLLGCLLDRFYWDAKYGDPKTGNREEQRRRFAAIKAALFTNPSPYSEPPEELRKRLAPKPPLGKRAKPTPAVVKAPRVPPPEMSVRGMR